MHLKKGDLVVVISGQEKGRATDRGRVLKVLRDQNQVIVQGLNLKYKHLRRSQKHPQGGRVQKETPISASNVMLVDPKTNEPTRVGFRMENGKKVRYAKRSGEPV